MAITLRMIEAQLRNEVTAAWGSPIARIQADPEMRARLNAIFRFAAMGGNDDGLALANRVLGAAGIAPITHKAEGENSGEGATLIMQHMADAIYDTLMMFGIWPMFDVQPQETEFTNFVVQNDRPNADFLTTEAASMAQASFTTGINTIQARLICASLSISFQIIEDTEYDLTQNILTDLGQAIAQRLDHMALQADGTLDANSGGFFGISTINNNAQAGLGGTTVENTIGSDWVSAITPVPAPAWSRCGWWLNPATLVRMCSVKDLNGRPIFRNALEAPAPGIGSILGFPVTLSAALTLVNAPSSVIACFGDPLGYKLRIRKGAEFGTSDHNAWRNYQRNISGVVRSGGAFRTQTKAFSRLFTSTS